MRVPGDEERVLWMWEGLSLKGTAGGEKECSKDGVMKEDIEGLEAF